MRQLLTSVCSLWMAFCAVADELPDEMKVVDPLQSELAQRNFKSCFQDVTREELDALKVVSLWKYNFSPIEGCPPTSPECNPKVKYFRVDRTIQLKHNDMTYSRVQDTVNAQNNGSCTSPREMGQVRRTLTTKQIRFDVKARERARVCPFWGGSWTVFEGTADVVFGYNFAPNFGLVPFNRVESREGEFFGFMSGDFAKFLMVTMFPSAPLLITFAAVKMEDINDKLDELNFMGIGVDLTRAFRKGPLSDLAGIPLVKLNFATNDQTTGFRDGGSYAFVEINQVDYINTESILDNTKLFLQTEVDFLRQIGEVTPTEYTVKKGDNLWNITKAHYRDPRLHLFVAKYAGAEGRVLRPGETLTLPKWHELCEKLKPQGLFVRQGQSLWAKARAGEIPSDLSLVKTLSGNAALIYPFEELEVVEAAPN